MDGITICDEEDDFSDMRFMRNLAKGMLDNPIWGKMLLEMFSQGSR